MDHVNWRVVPDGEAPEGWAVTGFTSFIDGGQRFCANGWNAYAQADNQGQLWTTLQGSGRATVKYRDCWAEGFVGLYVNGEKKDETDEENPGVQSTYRCCSGIALLNI